MKTSISLAVIACLTLMSCSIIQPGEVGVKSRLGQLNEDANLSGTVVYNPLLTRIIKLPTRTINRVLAISLPSKEGLTINADISILYHIKPEMAPDIIRNVGTSFEERDQIITSVFRSSSADVCARFYAKDMHSGKRGEIEKMIAERMNEVLVSKGFNIEAVLLKSIQLPQELSSAIERKLSSEQESQRMEFELITEQREAERKIIEAKGTRDAQLILSEGLTPEILKLRQIEAMRDLAKSDNSKIVVMDGKSPLMLEGD